MQILTLGIDKFPERAGLVQTPHRMQVIVKTRGLEHHVLPATGANRIEQPVRIIERSQYSWNRAGHVLVVLEDFRAMTGMACGICCHKYSLDTLILDQLFKGRVGL